MSCHMVEAEHVHVLIWAAIHAAGPRESVMQLWTVEKPTDTNAVQASRPYNVRILRPGTETPTGQMLVEANADSVRARHGDAALDGDVGFVYEYRTPRDRNWSPVEILSALNGYEYQACESDEWQGSEAKHFCDQLRRRVEARLPGASNGPWTIDDDSVSALTTARLAARAEHASTAPRRGGLRAVDGR